MWNNPGGEGQVDISVVQIGSDLHFYLVRNTTSTSVSSGSFSTTVDLTAYASDDTDLIASSRCDYTHGNGYLIVAHPYMDPVVISYDHNSGTITPAKITIEIRDTDGIPDETGFTYDSRPTSLTPEHQYNLYNQSWAPTATANYINSWRNSGALLLPAITGSGRTDYPSNADVWWLYIDVSNNFALATVDKNTRGNTKAPRGHYVYNAFDIDRSTTSGIAGLPVVTSQGHRPSAVAFFSGRVVYSGVDHPDYSNTLYISKTIENRLEFGKCLQTNDPTNQTLFDILATDGGVIKIPDCGKIVKLFSLGTTLLIFSTDGIWSLSGNQGIGFTATDFSIRKVSSIPALSNTSFVDVDGMPVWWNNDGIYMVTGANAVGAVEIECLTEKTFRTWYNNQIPVENKLFTVGAYNPINKQVIWLFRSTPIESFSQRFEFNRALVYNAMTKSFSPWSFPTDSTVKVNGLLSMTTQGSQIETLPVYDTLGNYTYNGYGELITERTMQTSLRASVFKYLTTAETSPLNYEMTWAEIYDNTFVDFRTYDGVGVNFTSYFITGYKLASGQAQRKFQANYVTIFVKNIDNPEFYFQGIWNFGNSIASGHYGTKQHLVFAYGLRDYEKRKVKIRGSGLSLQMKFTSVDGKPFDISGWTRFETANRVV